MKKWKHINYDQRKSISSGIAHNMKLKNISDILDLDPTSVSREVKKIDLLLNQLNKPIVVVQNY